MRATLAAVALILCFSTLAAAEPTAGSRAEAIAMVKRVQQKFAKAGPQVTFDAITSSAEFHDRDLYPFVYDTEGWSVAHGANPQMVGKLWISTKDQDGNYLIKEMVAITRGPGQNFVRPGTAERSAAIGDLVLRDDQSRDA